MRTNESASDFEVKVCATPEGPCVEAKSPNFWEAVSGVLVVGGGLYLAGHVLNAIFAPEGKPAKQARRQT